jgi:sugar phosphate isomerase/epimerase
MKIGDDVPSLGLAHFSALSLPPGELVKVAAKAGFKRVGLRLHPAIPGGLYYELPPQSATGRDLRGRLNGEGITVYDIETVVIDSSFDASLLAPVLESGSALGAKTLNVCGDDPDRSRLLANFCALCELAAKSGMGIDLENMGWRTLATFSDCVSLVSDAGMANATVIVDALHFSRNGGVPSHLKEVPASLICSAQLCDAGPNLPRSAEEMIHEARSSRYMPGRGTLPLAEIALELPDHTVLSVEVPMQETADAEVHVAQLFQTTREVLAQAMNAKH